MLQQNARIKEDVCYNLLSDNKSKDSLLIQSFIATTDKYRKHHDFISVNKI